MSSLSKISELLCTLLPLRPSNLSAHFRLISTVQSVRPSVARSFGFVSARGGANFRLFIHPPPHPSRFA